MYHRGVHTNVDKITKLLGLKKKKKKGGMSSETLLCFTLLQFMSLTLREDSRK